MGLKQLVGAVQLFTSFYAGRGLPTRVILLDRSGRIYLVSSVRRCYIGVLDIYMNPNTLTMMDLLEVNTFKLMDCNKAHYDKEIVQ